MPEANRPGGSPKVAPARPLATTFAVLFAYFLTPPVQHITIGIVTAFSENEYGASWWLVVIEPLWWVACAAFVFFSTRELLPRAYRFIEFLIVSRLR